MNAAQAKKVSLYDLLTHLGYTSCETRKGGKELWYESPFRNETKASFKIRVDQIIWYDFGEGKGGNVLDFVMKFKGCDLKEALVFLGDIRFKRIRSSFMAFSPKPASIPLFDASNPLILEIKPVNHYILKEYLKERCIPPEIGFKYLQQIKYKVDQKEYFALGFPNRAGGWEVRSSVFKGCIGKKDISILESGSKKVSAFEGFLDFLSYLTLSGKNKIEDDVIVMNSVALRMNAIELIKVKEYSEVKTYFDNDKAGRETLEFFQKELLQQCVTSCNKLYERFNDFNDFLKNFQKEKIRN